MTETRRFPVDVSGCDAAITQLSQRNPDFTADLSELEEDDIIFETEFVGGRIDLVLLEGQYQLVCKGLIVGRIDAAHSSDIAEIIQSGRMTGAWMKYDRGRCLEVYDDDGRKKVRRLEFTPEPVLRIEMKREEPKEAPPPPPEKPWAKVPSRLSIVLGIVCVVLGLLVLIVSHVVGAIVLSIGIINICVGIKSKQKEKAAS